MIISVTTSLRCLLVSPLLQEIFPVYFGPKYDAALEMLVWEFISRLEELLPVPDFTQVLASFSSGPPAAYLINKQLNSISGLFLLLAAHTVEMILFISIHFSASNFFIILMLLCYFNSGMTFDISATCTFSRI